MRVIKATYKIILSPLVTQVICFEHTRWDDKCIDCVTLTLDWCQQEIANLNEAREIHIVGHTNSFEYVGVYLDKKLIYVGDTPLLDDALNRLNIPYTSEVKDLSDNKLPPFLK